MVKDLAVGKMFEWRPIRYGWLKASNNVVNPYKYDDLNTLTCIIRYPCTFIYV